MTSTRLTHFGRARHWGALVGSAAFALAMGVPALAGTSVSAPAGEAAAAQSTAVADPAGGHHGAQCFFRQEWRGLWKVTPDARTMYVRVSHRVYRLELAMPYPLLKSKWAVLSNRDSSNTICSPIDFRFVVTDRLGAHEAVIVKRMTQLTPAEAAALPKKLSP